MNYLSKYRTELMGFSILWIMLFHSKIYIPDILSPFLLIKSSGYAGVDIFFLLSGFGVSYSLSKNPTVKEFFVKRLVRILPVFWAVVLLYFFMEYVQHDFDCREVLFSFFGLDFILSGDLKFWFIPAIFISYLIAPLFHSSLQKRAVLFTLNYSVVSILILLVSAALLAPHLLIFFTRIPIFLFGIYVGYSSANNRETRFLNNFFANAVVLLVSTAALVYMLYNTDSAFRWQTGLWWYPTIFLAYPICYFVSFAIDNYAKFFPYLIRLLRLSGSLSLELYLIHNLILLGTERFSIDAPATLMQVIYIVLSFIFAWIMKYGLARIDWVSSVHTAVVEDHRK